MAKVPFSKLGLKAIDSEIKTIEFNDQSIEIKQYLPIEKKAELIGDVVNIVATDFNFSNPIKYEVFSTLYIVEYYTNISFTDKQKEDPSKLYDLLISSGLSESIFVEIPRTEYTFIFDGIKNTLEAVFKYRNSAVGILDNLTNEYRETEFNADNIKQKLADPENLALLKDIMTKLG